MTVFRIIPEDSDKMSPCFEGRSKGSDYKRARDRVHPEYQWCFINFPGSMEPSPALAVRRIVVGNLSDIADWDFLARPFLLL